MIIIHYVIFVLLFVAAVYYVYPEKGLPTNIVITNIVIDKSSHNMKVFSNGILVKTYSVSIGRGVYGIHDSDWDNITPTGTFIVDGKFAGSRYHKAITISYGNEIELHGIKNGLEIFGKFHRWIDWTRGCIAVTNSEIDELYQAVHVGTAITITD